MKRPILHPSEVQTPRLRWLFVVGLLALTAFALSGVSKTPPEGNIPTAEDEILAYHIVLDRDLVLKIPIEIDAVEITTWTALLGDDSTQTSYSPACDSAKRYAYGFVATLVDQSGHEVARHDYDLESRISCDPNRPPGEGDYAARLAHRSAPVTDPRVTVVKTRDVLPRGGLLRLRAKPTAVLGQAIQLLMLTRIEGRYRRGEATQAIFEQSLDAEKRTELSRGTSALGFADLPDPARAALLTGWARRLEAAGNEGIDYHVSRLFLRRFRTPYPRAEGRGAFEFVIGEQHAAALNFRGPVQLDIEGPVDRKVRVADGFDSFTILNLGSTGKATVPLARQDIRTAVIDGIGPDFAVRFAVPKSQVNAQIGEIVHPTTPDGLRAETPPDVRVVRYLNLDPFDPVITRVAKGQQLLGILLRTEVQLSSGVDQGDATVIARWGDNPANQAQLHVRLPRSRFEWWTEGFDATEPRLAILSIPPGVETINITGDPKTRIRMRTLEPGVQQTLYRLPYRVELREDEVWRYAPFDVNAWADIRAVNLDTLERTGRFSDLREQVRIERSGQIDPSKEERPERIVFPDNAPVRRRLLVPAFQSAGEAFASDAWTPMLVPKRLVVESEGPSGGRLNVIYRTDKSRLGKPIKLRVDGRIAKEDTIVALSGTLRVNVAAGVHQVAVEGLGDRGIAYANAAPADGGAIVRRRDVHELTRARPLIFRFPQKPGETLHLVLFAVTQGGNAPFRLRYAIEGVRPASRTGTFFRRVTLPDGLLAARGGDFGKATLWEATSDQRGVDGIARMVIRLGDDLRAGERRVLLQLQSPPEEQLAERVWISAVLVGQQADAKRHEPRAWLDDDL